MKVHGSRGGFWVKKKKKILLVLIMVVFVIGFVVFIRRGSKSLSIEVESIEFSTIEKTVDIYGIIEPKETFDIFLPLQQRVTEVFVIEGQEVQEGQILAKLDPSSLEIQREKLLIQKSLLTRDKEDLQRGGSYDERMDIQNAVVAARTLLEAARERMDDAQKSQDVKKQEYQQSKIPFEEVQRSELFFLDAKAQYESVRKTYESAQNKKNSFEEDLQIRIQNIEAQVQLLVLDIQDIEKRIEDTFIRSETNGLLVLFGLKENLQVNAQNNQITTIDKSELKLVSNVPQDDAVEIREVQMATIILKSTSRIYKGKVSSIKEIASTDGGGQNQLPRQRVEISIMPPLDNLTVGFEADANVVVKKLGDVLVVKRRNLLKDDEGNPYVFIVKEDRARRKFVKTGLFTDFEVEIVEGLDRGDLVIKNPSSEILEGALLEIKSEPGF
jgi:HlyD family secretion protein